MKRALEALAAEYAEKGGALEVAKAGAKWAMQVRAEYAPAAVRLAPMEIAPRFLKTLALIAYHQPLLQSDLVDMVGAKAYEHVHELAERGLVRKRLDGRSFALSTSELFPEYFGIPATDREAIRRYLADKVGLPVPKADARGQTRLPDEGAPAGEAPAPATPETAAREPETAAPAPEPSVSEEAPVQAPDAAPKHEPETAPEREAEPAPASEPARKPEPGAGAAPVPSLTPP